METIMSLTLTYTDWLETKWRFVSISAFINKFNYLISKSNHHNKNEDGKKRLKFPQSVFVEEKESEGVSYCNQYTSI